MNEYLWEFAQKLPSDNKFQIVLKSALLQTASVDADIGKTNDKWMCRKCKTLWMHGYFHVDEIKCTNRFDQLLEKYRNKSILTKKEQSHYDYLLSRKHVSAKYTCKVCSYKTRVTTKPVVIPESKKEEKVPLVVKSNKKKRNRDVNAGLNLPSTKSSPLAAAKPSCKKSRFTSRETNELSALANMLKKKSSEGMSSEKPHDRLKKFLQ